MTYFLKVERECDVSDHGYNCRTRAGTTYVLEVEREGEVSDRRCDWVGMTYRLEVEREDIKLGTWIEIRISRRAILGAIEGGYVREASRGEYEEHWPGERIFIEELGRTFCMTICPVYGEVA